VALLEVTLVWVAIIAASSGLIGVAISGIVTTKQSNTQMKMHRNTLQQQTDEARRDRIVAARKPLLIKLRESLGHVWGSSSNLVAAKNTIQIVQSSDVSANDLQQIEQQKTDYQDKMLKHVEDATWLLPQISDTTLKSQTEAYMAIFSNIIDATALNNARQHLLVVNKRIEELLAGDEPT